MPPYSRHLVRSVLAASLASAALIAPSLSVASAAEARVVVAASDALPTSSTIVASPITTNFDVALALKDPAGLSQFLSGLTNPSSPLYRHYLTPTSFAQRFGASDATITSVRSYLSKFGVRVRTVNTGKTLLELSGRTSDIARAFATPVQTVRLSNGTLHAHFTRAATLPMSIAHDITSVAGLSSVTSPSPRLVSSRSVHHSTVALPTTCASAQASRTNAPNVAGGYSVQQQAQLYGLAGAWAAGKTGVGQTIGVYELGQYDATDVANYFSCYGISPVITPINVDGGTVGAYSDEATMDVEAASALAPGAAIEVYQAPNNSTGPLDLYSRIASDNTATIVSTSWGDCETDPTGAVSAEQVIFEQMAAQGQTVIAASGDSGSSDCTGVVSNAPAVDDPASQPFVTGVGGLSVTSIASPLTQTVWNANGGAGGGGVSQVWSRPSWQNAPGIAPSQTMRMVPDLSVMADPATGFMQNYTGKTTASVTNWSSIGGTSIGAPLVSALVAVAAQVCGTPRLGFINPTLYALARSSKGFVDVTTGNNDLFGTGVYAAGVGYDMASGLGSPDATFVNDLCPSAASPGKSSLESMTKTSVINSNSHFTVALRDNSGNPVVNSAVTLVANAASGHVAFDSDPTSARSSGRATYVVSSDSNGNANFTLSTSSTGPVKVTVKLNGAVLYVTTINFHPLPLSKQLPLAPTITHVTAHPQGAVISLAPHRANTPFVVALQVSVDGGRTWHSYPGTATTIVLTQLKARTKYVIHVRAKNGNGYSAQSHAIRLTTLR